MVIVEFVGLPQIEQASLQMVSSMPLGTSIAPPAKTDNGLVPQTYFVVDELPPIWSTEHFQINVAFVAYGRVKNDGLYVTIVLNNWYSTVYPWLSLPLP